MLTEGVIETGDGDDNVKIQADAGNGTYVTTGNGNDKIFVHGGMSLLKLKNAICLKKYVELKELLATVEAHMVKF